MKEIKQETDTITINHDNYCVYCGKKAHNIQANIEEYDDFSITGYYCDCIGAKNELEYKNKVSILLAKHKEEFEKLRNEFNDKLKYCTKKLFKIKQLKEKERFDFFHRNDNFFNSYFTTINGKRLIDIDDCFFE